MSGPMTSVVVVGGGVAGARTCAELRKQGHTGPVTLLCQEHSLPYDRPPLSKAVLSGKRESKPLKVDYTALDIDVRLGCAARGADLEAGLVLTEGGDVPFDRLVVATGSRPVRLPGTGEQLVLRTQEDAHDLRTRLSPGAHLVVIGASWIGAEVASTALGLGARVTCVELGAAPVAQALGAELGSRFLPWWGGVDLRLGSAVESVDPGRVRLTDGTVLRADLVLTGVGVRPETGWLAGSAIDPLGRALATDEFLRTTHPQVLALGDAATWWSRRFHAQLDVQHWDDASGAAAVVASSVVKGAASDTVHDPVPYFWSDQFGHRVEYVGHHESHHVRIDREAVDGGWTATWLDGSGRLTAVLAVDLSKEVAAGRRLVAVGQVLPAGDLASTPLVELESGVSA